MTFADYLRRKGVQVMVTPQRVIAYTVYAFGCLTATGVLYRVIAGGLGLSSVVGIGDVMAYLGTGGVVASVAILAAYRGMKGR